MSTKINVPKNLRFTDQTFDISLHPSKNLVATGLLSGYLFINKYKENESNVRVYKKKVHSKTCRTLSFSVDGKGIYTGSKDKSWNYIDLEKADVLHSQLEAHKAPINRLMTIDEHTLATGDDNGTIKVWDVRSKKQALVYKEHVDYISDMIFNQKKRNLIVTSGDGCLSVYDIRKTTPIMVSDNQDEELSSVALVRNGSKVAVGTQEGVLGLFKYGQFGDVSDRFPGNPSSIESLCKINENTLIAGGGDGHIRVISLYPHSYSGKVGKHGALPVERVLLTWDKKYLVSLAQDSKIKFWNTSSIYQKYDQKISFNYDSDSSSGTSSNSDSATRSDSSSNSDSDSGSDSDTNSAFVPPTANPKKNTNVKNTNVNAASDSDSDSGFGSDANSHSDSESGSEFVSTTIPQPGVSSSLLNIPAKRKQTAKPKNTSKAKLKSFFKDINK